MYSVKNRTGHLYLIRHVPRVFASKKAGLCLCSRAWSWKVCIWVLMYLYGRQSPGAVRFEAAQSFDFKPWSNSIELCPAPAGQVPFVTLHSHTPSLFSASTSPQSLPRCQGPRELQRAGFFDNRQEPPWQGLSIRAQIHSQPIRPVPHQQDPEPPSIVVRPVKRQFHLFLCDDTSGFLSKRRRLSHTSVRNPRLWHSLSARGSLLCGASCKPWKAQDAQRQGD